MSRRALLGPLHGYRVWFPRYGQADSFTGLSSIAFVNTRWPTGGWLEASCPYGCDEAPAPGCTCGVWGYLRPGGIRVHGTMTVRGEVELAGRVVVHTGGWRAQMARVAAIHDPGEGARGDVREASREAARLYGVPFVRVPQEPTPGVASIP